MRRASLLAALVTVGLGLSLQAASARQQQQVYRIPVTGDIENGLAPYVARALKEAQEAGADAAFLDIDTPGGRIDAAERISDAVRAAEIPVYAFVNPRAYSAGAMIALSTKGIYMKPGAVLGAATPVDGKGTKAPEKYVSAMRAEFRALAEQHGLDPRVAEKMVDESIDLPGIAPAGQLLTLSTNEALNLKYAKAEVADEAALLEAIGMKGAEVTEVSPNWAEKLVGFLTSPVVSPLLLSLGLLGLIFEIKAGAFGIGGLVSLASLGLFFGSSFLLGLAGWEVVLLLGLGALALALELFVLPGFGVAGVLGILSFTAAIVLALAGTTPSWNDVGQALAILGASLTISAAVFFAWIRHLPNSPRFRQLLLTEGHAAAEGYISAPTRMDLVGKEGVAVTDLRPSGTAVLGEERLDVVTEGEFIRQGTQVRVVRSEGYRHVVRAVA